MNDRERVTGWATAASTATLALAGHLVTPSWWAATMTLLTLGVLLARASDRSAGAAGSQVVLVLLRVVTLAVVLALLVTLLTNRSLALASLFALGIAPMLGTESLLVLVGCALVAVPLADPFQPATPLVGVVYLGVWALALLTAVMRASGRLPMPAMGYAAYQRVQRLPSTSRMIRRPLIWAVAGGLLAAAMIPLGPPRPLTAAAGEWSAGTPGDGSGQARIDLTGGGDVDLAQRGTLFTDPIAVVPTDSPAYWRSGLLTGYDGRMLTLGTASDGAPDAPQVLEPNTPDGRTIAIPGTARRVEADPQGPAVTYPVQPRGGDSGVAVIAPGPLSAVTPATPERLLYSDRLAVLSSSNAYQVTAVATVDLDELTAVLPVPSGLAARLAAADRWLALPTSVSPRTRDLAHQITAGTSDRAQAVAAIRAYLTSRYTYDLKAPVPPEGQDSVDFFLFDSHRGYCVHFAAAELVLLRAVGIPARVITGYLGGQADPENPGDRVITADRGHAWTEAFLPAVGWVRSDATPAGALDADAARRPWTGWRTVPTRALLGALGGTLGVATLVAAAVWTARRRRLRRRARTLDPAAAPGLQASGHPDLERAYDRLDQALARTSLPRAPTETLTELACRVPRARDGLTVLARSRYDAHEPGAQERASAAAILDDAADAIQRTRPEPLRNGALRRTVAWPGPRRRPARGRSRPR